MPAARIFLQLIADLVVYLGLLIRPRKAIAAENLFLRRQLALYQERKVDPRRIDPATRITLALLSRLFNWRDALIVVQPKTLIRWHRAGFRLLWHWKSKPGRPPIPAELRRLIREMSRFLCGGHGELSRSIHLCDHRARLTPSSPLECDVQSDGSLDVAAVARGDRL